MNINLSKFHVGIADMHLCRPTEKAIIKLIEDCIIKESSPEGCPKMSEQTTLEVQIKQALARGYCYPENSHKEMDGALAYAMAEEVMKIMPELESKPFRPTVKKVVVNPNLSLDIFFNEQELLPINVELELKFQEPQATKYPFDFVEWMKKKNFILNDGKFFADDLVILKDEQVGELWNEFIGDVGELKTENETYEQFQKDLCVLFLDELYDETPLELVRSLIEKNEKLGKEYVLAVDTWRNEVNNAKAGQQKLQKDVDDLTRAYAKQIQLIVDVTDKVRTIIGIEPIEFVKKELEELKEVLLTHMEESAK